MCCKKKESSFVSYFSRFVLTHALIPRYFFSIEMDRFTESPVFNKMRKKILKWDLQRKKRNLYLKKKSLTPPLGARKFRFGVLYLKYLRNNLFANLIWEVGHHSEATSSFKALVVNFTRVLKKKLYEQEKKF